MTQDNKNFLNYISRKKVDMNDVITLLFLNYIERGQDYILPMIICHRI